MAHPVAGLKVLLVTGDRNWQDKEVMAKALNAYAPHILIEGEARGADKLSRYWAEEQGYTHLGNGNGHNLPTHAKYDRKRFVMMPADWDKYGRSAGPIRNRLQASLLTWCREQGARCRVYAFHDAIDESKGTKDMINVCIKSGFDVTLFTTFAEPLLITWKIT